MPTDSTGQAGVNQLGFERLSEGEDSLSRSLREVDERWDKRFVLNQHTLAEDYLGGRFAFVFKLRVKAGSEADCVAYAACHCDAEGVSVLVSHDRKFGAASLEQQPVVLVPVAQFVEDADRDVSALSFVSISFYPVEEQRLRLLSGGTYWSLLDNGFYALPIVRNGHGFFVSIGAFVGTDQAHPTEIQSSSEVATDVASHEGKLGWNGLTKSDLERVAAGLGVIFQGGNVRFRFKEGSPHLFEVLNVYCGPFDL